MIPDLMHLDYALFAVALVISAGAVALSRWLWNRVGRTDWHGAKLYGPREFIADLRTPKGGKDDDSHSG